MVTKATSIRLDEKKLRRLDRLARTLDRPRSWVLSEAVDRYLDHEEWFAQEVARGIAEADRGEFVPHDKVIRDLRRRARKLRP
jgi:predicted transcriptional regulator